MTRANQPQSPPLDSHRERLIAQLRRLQPADPLERDHRSRIESFVLATPDCFERGALPGHITGSAFIVDPRRRVVLLHHHRKLDRWLQMGGHDEGEGDAEATALREAREESGLSALQLATPGVILDVDIHRIPARGADAAHDHLDVRFLVLADSTEPLRPDREESLDIAWFTLEAAELKMAEPGSTRALKKIASYLSARGMADG